MSEQLRIVIAQLNFFVGDIEGNTQKIITAIQKARDELHGDLVLFPELALCGYPPEDLLLRSDFEESIKHAVKIIQEISTDIDVVLTLPEYTSNGVYNAAYVIRDKKIIATYHKQCLPNYEVFDEKRYFINGSSACVFEIKNIKCGIVICEDLWHPEPIMLAKQAGAHLVLNPNASPFDLKKHAARINVVSERVKENSLPIIYANHICGQDDLVFDGGSFAMDARGIVCTQAEQFEEKLFPVDIKINSHIEITKSNLPKLREEAAVYNALVLAIRDYVNKNNFAGALLGLSGGIDSALTLAIAVDALGKDRVEAVLLPSRYTTDLSTALGKKQTSLLSIKSEEISIEPSFKAFLESLKSIFSGLPANVTEENIQARCRGTILMALSNKSGKILLNTSNKSELAMGYGTLYGDMAGGYAVLKDVPKTLVYKLANYRNSIDAVIPQEVIERAPTAELAPNQKDQDTLPPYATLDSILEMYIEQDKSLADIVAAGFAENTVRKVISTVEKNEYKRRQAAPGPRITPRAFGRERRYPMTSKFNKE